MFLVSFCWAQDKPDPVPADNSVPRNLLLNSSLGFHCFTNSRTGRAPSFNAGAVAGWNQDAYGDAEAYRAARTTALRPTLPVDNVVVIHPGKRFYQFALLTEMGLGHGDVVSFSIHGRQQAPESLQAAVHLMRLDSQSGEWTAPDGRTFPKHSRGELVRGPSYTAASGSANEFRVVLENCRILGEFTESPDKSTDQPNTIGIEVELVNRSKDQDVWIYAPCLCRGPKAKSLLPELRPMPDAYRGIPRTIQKLWRGEPLHIIIMGSSIDRGSANPPMVLYDEDPQSPSFKRPKSVRDFDGAAVGHPEWNDYIGWWQHYFMYGGRLRRLLMEKFDYPMEKLLLNTMACDGSSISESHSGLAEYASLSLPPDPGVNGHKTGKTWQELYPAVFARPEGPRPDLVIFGSGANEKVDGAAEIALFEGTIRWFQRHYPHTEFLFCMWQNRESYTPNTGHLMELALRYQIPYLDFARQVSLTTRHCNSYALCPRDGHPQAAGHFLWAKQLERAFDVADPIEPGIAQLHLPERVHPASLGWEGDISTYAAPHARIRQDKAFILDDTMVNLWGTAKDPAVGIRIDGQDTAGSRRRPSARRDLRNSAFATGLLSLGDRHIVEVTGADARLVAADSKIIPDRQWYPVDSSRWDLAKLKVEPYESAWGSPYGSKAVQIPAGQPVECEVVGTAFSIAYVDREKGGIAIVEVDGRETLRQPTNVPFTTAAGETLYMENRQGILGLRFGVHAVRIAAADGPITLLGVFSYDTRPSRDGQRVLRGTAWPGETLAFHPPFAARPIVVCSGELRARSSDVGNTAVRFSGSGAGAYEIVGE